MACFVRPVMLAIALVSMTTRVSAQRAPDPAAIAERDDAAAYADRFAVSTDVARTRLRAQEALAPTIAALRLTYRARLAGIAIEHAPELRVVVLLAGDEAVADRTVDAAGLAVPIVFTTGAAVSLEQLRTALANGQASIRAALRRPPGMGIDQRTGELVVVVGSDEPDVADGTSLADRLRAIAGVPVRLRTAALPVTNLAAEGGARLIGTAATDGHRYVCTAGFVVSDGTRTGIATAAHCPDAIGYVDADRREWPLAFAGQWGWGYQDVQINVSDTLLAPLFFDDTARTTSRTLHGQRRLDETVAGDFVCHRGERTGYSCALVELTDFAPAGELCGGFCTPTWVTVAGPRCGGGDSGAPVFANGVAYGIVKGGSYGADGSCGFYFYMSTDYLPTGWHLSTSPGDGALRERSPSDGRPGVGP